MDSQSLYLLLFITLLPLIALLISYKRNRGSIYNGFYFLGFIGALGIDFIAFAFSSQNKILMILAGLIAMVFVVLSFFGTFILIIALFKNARNLIQKEGFRFHNLLTLFAAIGLVILLIIPPIVNGAIPEDAYYLRALYSFFMFAIYYFIFVFILFLLASWIYRFAPNKANKDFIIVLGSGLRNGREVPPLLASRIDYAIEFYQKHEVKPILIFSGGRGDDEHLAEGVAMKDYAIHHGIPEDHAIAEDQSRNTYENMLFSKRIMDNLKPDGKYKVAFSSNNFHIFRADRYARMVGLKNTHGIAAKTATYFIPNAMIREYIALIVMTKRTHIVVLSLVFILIFTFAVVSSILL
ncbi:YdcF family protein [Erysipelothrix inopinata]|uniref:YdcF family protein n=1 Tax=Erysipelothrix inopinata TaxID=225084 RepID=A0A7G9RZD8_9FIRM|nr:YdcF family protein [Erysipelothrix inopinata]QNN60963.1 YdcF family protein [Erysipelothrix inopinata]